MRPTLRGPRRRPRPFATACLAAAVMGVTAAAPRPAIAAQPSSSSSSSSSASSPPPAGAAASAAEGNGPAGSSGSSAAGSFPSPVPPTAQTASAPATPDAPGMSGGAGAGAPAPAQRDDQAGYGYRDRRVIVTRDATPALSDHDLLVGAWGLEVRPVATTLPVFTRRLASGCPLAPPSTDGISTAGAAGVVPPVPASTSPATASAVGTNVDGCPPIAVSMLSVRHWVTHNLAWTVGAALALGGGSQGGRLLDSYFGFGPAAGLSLLLGNWRHLSVAASPSVALVWFKAAGAAPFAYVADVRADLEGELHFGFIGVPALTLGIRSGVLLRVEKAGDVTLWSAGVSGATSLKGLVSDLSLRYYF